MWLSVFFALIEVGAYLSFFLMFWDCLRRCPLTVASQLGDERQALVRPTFLGPSPCGASSAVPKDGCLVVLGAARWCSHLGSTSDDQYPEPPACRIGTAASSDIFYLPFHTLSHRYRAWKCWRHRRHRSVLSACAMKFFGGVQCAQYCPHPLHLWLICHGLASWNSDSEVLGS